MPHKIGQKNFEYKRSKLSSKIDCSITRRSGISAQLTDGRLKATGLYPELALFRINDGEGANIRIDDANLEPVEHIRGGNLSLDLPFWIPFVKNSIIQSRKLTTSFFYDYGKVYEPEHAYYKASGASLSLPLGGDIAGTSPITFSKLSFSVIYFNDKNGERSFDKHYLFNISGSL